MTTPSNETLVIIVLAVAFILVPRFMRGSRVSLERRARDYRFPLIVIAVGFAVMYFYPKA